MPVLRSYDGAYYRKRLLTPGPDSQLISAGEFYSPTSVSKLLFKIILLRLEKKKCGTGLEEVREFTEKENHISEIRKY